MPGPEIACLLKQKHGFETGKPFLVLIRITSICRETP